VSYEDCIHTYDVEQVNYLIEIPSAIKGLVLKTPLSKLIEDGYEASSEDIPDRDPLI
jgi:hypothetical protein